MACGHRENRRVRLVAEKRHKTHKQSSVFEKGDAIYS